ncbi:MAG: site-specific DNA-methyltransferase [Desulfobacterales bacterium]|jgi:site-specific DNA-methyltransferase (cytosine-N4-specific)|nr:site-specific DNA-methyltransferase [Desulfobacterales bacterium]
MNKAYKTDLGKYYIGYCEQVLKSNPFKNAKGKVQLILTSPPFPLNNKKKYGNLNGDEYKKWIESLAPVLSDFLTEDGSIVIELGNAWEPKRPIQSLLPLESLLSFVGNKKANLRLCQEFVCYNPSRLPSPAQWVTVNRIRTIDSYTHVWWMAKSDFPKANNKKILRPYSKSMEALLKRKSYNSGKRPSEHTIGEKSFLKRNEGSITHNVIELEQIDNDRDIRLPKNIFSFANTNSNDYFLKKCREKDIQPHPARMPLSLAAFFIEFLTDEGDLVLDPFGGTNTTGYCAEKLGRKWLAIEADEKYADQSLLRFSDPKLNTKIKIL